MNTAHTIVTVLAAAWIGFSAYATLTTAPWVVDNLADYGVPTTWWPWLAATKATGAIGLIVGLAVPPVGIAATLGIVLYFSGALITVIHAHAYGHIPFPLLYMAPVVAAAALDTGALQ
jgi:hypothetical protein